MLRTEQRLGRTLEAYFAERYPLSTQVELAAELGISDATVSRWMRDLGIETRFPGQRPQAAA
jgi:DNA-binding MurR/RpiR family transcriptional regulator